ncbi:hypothetical protein [Niabella beijingensis]|uniref:hypothetical protein n=1 Tax=Niabella beijingensis TaxID=2872700 RepID=UPI001CBA9863|nr:hypothetical protein [Niabella beijingensis]MBZ4187816.1 hypothetical protein [Niabella beijingensis]
MEPVYHILIFKTNIATVRDRKNAALVLDEQPYIRQWSIDMEDVDRVLRVVSLQPEPALITNLITASGYYCAELEA